jgi:vacuolar iron transporter family protein
MLFFKNLTKTQFALTAGLSSLGSSHLVVTGGLAELFSGAISMGVGGYLSTKAERDNYRFVLGRTRQLVEGSCVRALEEEIFKILSPYGLTTTDSKRIVQSLNANDRVGFDAVKPGNGLTTFLLKFGEGVDHISTVRLYASALTIGLSYFIGGLIPMVCSS